MANDTPSSQHRNAVDAPAVTVVTDGGTRVPLSDALDGTVMAGDAPEVADSTAEAVADLVDDHNALLAALRTRGVLAAEEE